MNYMKEAYQEALKAGLEGEIPVGAVIVYEGGPDAVRAALAAKRRAGQRGKQKAPTKQRTTLRLSPDVLAHFRATGKGWQTRMDAALREWIAQQ